MNLSINKFGLSANLSFYRSTRVWGVNSNVEGTDKHVIMFDIDGHGFHDVCEALLLTQAKHNLSTIRILQSSDSQHFFGYCFTAVPFNEAVSIIAGTHLVDWRWVRLAVMRGYFTLRVTAKDQIEPAWVMNLDSGVPPDCTIYELKSWAHYWTHFRRDGEPRDGG